MIIALSGCEGFQKKHDNPVLVQAPRRLNKPVDQPEPKDDDYVQNSSRVKSTSKKPSSPKDRQDVQKDLIKTVNVANMDEKGGADKDNTPPSKEFDGSDIKQVSATTPKDLWENWKDDTAIFNAQVAATVNGAPILNGDVLDRYSGYLISMREEMQKVAKNPNPGQPVPTPDDYEKFRYQLIQREISSYIQRKLLVERLKSGLKPEQTKMMDDHIDDLFEKEIERLKREMKVSNKTELEIALNKKGTTLANVRANFALDRLSMECIGLKSERPKPVERPHLVAYYREHPEKFTYEAKVKWQQILVNVTPQVNKKAALKKIEQAVAELNAGASFDKVAKKYSEGPNAKQGGSFDWMEPGNLKDQKLEKMLFSMPLNQLSEIYESEDSVCVVRVVDRQEAGRKPFQDVQQEIRQILEEQQTRNGPKKLLNDLLSKAVIETQYTLPTFDTQE